MIILTNVWDKQNKKAVEKLKIHAYFVKAFLTTEDLAKEIEKVFADPQLNNYD